jgi:predicted secreted protein
MRKLALVVFFAILVVSAYAGDIASFVSLGFSPDGKRYSFGQYGVTDVDFRAYADILCVDVAGNDFVKGGKFSVSPSVTTSGKDGRGVFASLQNSSADFIRKIGVDSASQGRALYVRSSDEPHPEALSFRDFENGSSYTVTLNSLSEGSGKDIRSSFYLIVDVTAADGKSVRKTVGLPGFKREGVGKYLVRRIITDDSGKSLVFIIEKEQFDRNGNSVRFMVETLRL